MTLDLLSIGEVMAEIRQSAGDGYRVGFAGDTFNTAVYCARSLTIDGKVGYFSRVGQDPLSKSLLDFAKAQALDVTHVSQDSEKNIGLYSVSTDDAGERSFHYWRDRSAARRMFSSDAPKLPASQIVYLSGISLAILHTDCRKKLMDQLNAISEAGTSLIAFDSNYRPKLWESVDVARDVIRQMWRLADIALPSIDDEMALFDDENEEAVIERFSNKKWTACAIKRGERGPVSPHNQTASKQAYEPATHVVDTTAAGDSFNGAYIAAFLQGASEIDCLIAGHRCASEVVGVRGAIVPGK